jgi:hypothetical protein
MIKYDLYNINFYQKCINNYDISKNYNTPLNNNITIYYDNFIENLNEYENCIDDINNLLKNCNKRPFVKNISEIYNVDINNYYINKLKNFIIPYFETNIYNCYVDIIDFKVLKYLKGNHDNISVFNWHIDNHPDLILNIIIYLNEVNENGGQFQYLVNENNNECIKYNYSSPPGNKSMNNLLSKNIYKINNITGNKGKIFYFNNNIVHRACNIVNIERNSIIFQIAPCINKKI